MKKPPAPTRVPAVRCATASDRRADLRKDGADLGAEEDEGDDRDDRDQGEDQRIFGKTLAFLIPAEGSNECVQNRHVSMDLLSSRLPGRIGGNGTVRAPPPARQERGRQIR